MADEPEAVAAPERRFGALHRERLETCHPDLQRLFTAVLQKTPCAILEGHRGQTLQDLYYRQKRSKVQWPHGAHNRLPSAAVDVMPTPIEWKNEEGHRAFGRIVLETARELGIRVRWGHDWDMDGDLENQSFIDSPHWELVDIS